MTTHNQFLSCLTTLCLSLPMFVVTRCLIVCIMRVHTVVLKHFRMWGLKRLKLAKLRPWAVKTHNGSEVSELGRTRCGPWSYPNLFPLPIRTHEKRGENPWAYDREKQFVNAIFLPRVFVKLKWEEARGWRRNPELMCSRDHWRWSLCCNNLFCSSD